MTQNGFDSPYIDADEWRDTPVRHRYVHGGFEGTDARFSFYFPPEETYQGRFYQYITPVPDNETLSQGASGEDDKIGFSIASGAYFIETNGGGSGAVTGSGPQPDPTITAYRANAAAAEYSRGVAMEMYGGARPYGYAFGGSGGAFRTIGGMENAGGVWDGAVPYVPGSPMAIPNVFCIRMHAMCILHDTLPQIIDALEPGGSGDMYAGLDEAEAEALREVTRMGFPPQSWFGYETMGVHGFAAVYPPMLMLDPGYFEEFWTEPGYLGADDPASLQDARIQHATTLQAAIAAREARAMGLDIVQMPGTARGTADKAWQQLEEKSMGLPVAFQLSDTTPNVHFLGGDLIVKSGEAAGQMVQLRDMVRGPDGDIAILGIADPRVLAKVKPGDEVQVDTSNYMAAQTYHRHQVPGKEYHVWDQFRDANGEPIYPQRPMLIGPILATHTCGGPMTGKFSGKMIVVASLWDREAFPWQADWYRARVQEHLGDRTDDHYRLWYVDRALHGDVSWQEDPTRTVSYLGVLQQALRDVSAWVEEGVAPPATTRYEVVDGQVIVPERAAERRSIQPVVIVRANGKARAEVKAGEPVQFTAIIEVPPGTGRVVAAAWDFTGEGRFPAVEAQDALRTEETETTVSLTRTYTFEEPGTYFPVLRAAAQRDGDAATPYTRVQNLGRVRVVVR